MKHNKKVKSKKKESEIIFYVYDSFKLLVDGYYIVFKKNRSGFYIEKRE